MRALPINIFTNGILFIPGAILLCAGIFYFFKGLSIHSKDKKKAKKMLILAGVCFLIGVGMCGNYNNL